MSKQKYQKLVKKELDKVNNKIDKFIVLGRDYKELAIQHLVLIKLLK